MIAQLVDLFTPEQWRIITWLLVAFPTVGFLTGWAMWGHTLARKRWKLLAGYYVLLGGLFALAYLISGDAWSCPFFAVLFASPLVSFLLVIPF